MWTNLKRLMLLGMIGVLATCDKDRLPTETDLPGFGKIVIVFEDDYSEGSLLAGKQDSISKTLTQKEKSQKSPQLSAINQLEIRVLKPDNTQIASQSSTVSEGRFRGSIEVLAQSDLRVLCIGKNNGIVERFAMDSDVDVIAGRTTTVTISSSEWNAGYIPKLVSISPNPSTDGNFTVSWRAVTGATSYVLQEATNSNFSGARQVYTGSNRQASISGKSSGTYYYRVQATNDYTVTSGWSDTASVTVVTVPPDTTAPPPVTNFQAIAGDCQVSLSWINPTDSDYKGTLIKRNTGSFPARATDGTEVYRGTGTNVVDTTLTNGITYYYAAFTFDADSNYSAAVTASATPYSTETTNNIKITDSFGSPGSDVTVQVLVTSDKNIAGALFEIVFDSSLLQIKVAKRGSATTGMFSKIEVAEANTTGRLKVSLVDFSLSNPIPAGTDREILVITFTIATGASEDIPVVLSNLELSDESANDIPATIRNGNILVTE